MPCPMPPAQLAETFPSEARAPVPARGTVAVPDFDFPQQFSEFSFRTLLTKGEVISALGKVHVECSKVAKMSLFTTNHTKSLRLDEFEQGQMQVGMCSYFHNCHAGRTHRTLHLGTSPCAVHAVQAGACSSTAQFSRIPRLQAFATYPL